MEAVKSQSDLRALFGKVAKKGVNIVNHIVPEGSRFYFIDEIDNVILEVYETEKNFTAVDLDNLLHEKCLNLAQSNSCPVTVAETVKTVESPIASVDEIIQGLQSRTLSDNGFGSTKERVIKIFDDSHGRGASLSVFDLLERELLGKKMKLSQIVGLLQTVYLSGKRAGKQEIGEK